jgi:DNA-binding transcriptional LysR family regulator
MKSIDRFAEMEAFVEAARRMSFTAAADALEIPASVLSRRIKSLEARLGSRLFHRTTRSVGLTESGEVYFSHCTRLLAELRDADEAVTSLQQVPRGTLMLQVPTTFGRLHVAPAIPAFLKQYPNIDVDLTMSDDVVDLVKESVDVAIRIGQLPDSDLVARRLCNNRRILCASPDYLAEHGVPARPEDLENHSCLNFSHLIKSDIWHFDAETGTQAVSIKGRLRANNTEALREAALAGCGIAYLATFIVGDDIRSARLRPVLEAFPQAETGIYAIYTHRRYISAKTAAFLDFAQTRFCDPPHWDR